MLHPSVVDAVSATCAVDTPTSAATLAPQLLTRLEQVHEPCIAAASLLYPHSSSACTASIVSRASGPTLPACR